MKIFSSNRLILICFVLSDPVGLAAVGVAVAVKEGHDEDGKENKLQNQEDRGNDHRGCFAVIFVTIHAEILSTIFLLVVLIVIRPLGQCFKHDKGAQSQHGDVGEVHDTGNEAVDYNPSILSSKFA